MEDVAYSNSDRSKIVHIQCMKGNDFEREIIFRTSTDGGVTYEDDSISTDTFSLDVRCPKSGKIVLSFHMGKGAEIVSNKLVLSKTANQMNSVEGGTYRYRLEQKDGGTGKTRTRLRGNFIVND